MVRQTALRQQTRWLTVSRVEDVSRPPADPKKAFIIGALEKEIRLSFAARIRGTVPEPYRDLIPSSKEQDIPPFKYQSDQTPYAEPARGLLQLLRTKAPDADIAAGPLADIESLATSQGVTNPLLPSTDAYVTCICYLGSKSLSHMLSQIDRCKERLLSLGPRSDPAARIQIITSVMSYWAEKPGVGVNVVDKLLNFTILTPTSVILWALGPDNLGIGEPLMHEHVYEMVASTIGKVTQRVRQIVTARNAPGLPSEQIDLLEETLTKEREDMRGLFFLIEDAVVGVADGTCDSMAESAALDDGITINLLRNWGRKWLLVFRRWMAMEEAWLEENSLVAAAAIAAAEAEADAVIPAPATKMEDVVSGSNGTGKRRAEDDDDDDNDNAEAPVAMAGLVTNGTSNPRKKIKTATTAEEGNENENQKQEEPIVMLVN